MVSMAQGSSKMRALRRQSPLGKGNWPMALCLSLFLHASAGTIAYLSSSGDVSPLVWLGEEARDLSVSHEVAIAREMPSHIILEDPWIRSPLPRAEDPLDEESWREDHGASEQEVPPAAVEPFRLENVSRVFGNALPLSPKAPGNVTGSAGFVIPPSLGHNPPPEYPWEARRRGWEGRVLLRVRVGSSGQALSVEVVDSTGYRALDEAAKQAVQGWTFVPAMQGGQVVACEVEIPIRFVLK